MQVHLTILMVTVFIFVIFLVHANFNSILIILAIKMHQNKLNSNESQFAITVSKK